MEVKVHLKLTFPADFQQFLSSSFRETGNFRLCPIPQLSSGRNQKKVARRLFAPFLFLLIAKNRLQISIMVRSQSLEQILVVLKKSYLKTERKIVGIVPGFLDLGFKSLGQKPWD